MALFSNNPIRSAATAAVVVSIAHFATKFLSSFSEPDPECLGATELQYQLESITDAFQLTQTSIAILSISALLFMIMMHHRRDGQMLTQSQEEMAVIGIFALFWVVFLVGYKLLTTKQSGGGIGGGAPAAAEVGLPKVSQASPRWRDPCADDDVYCIYEEYTYF